MSYKNQQDKYILHKHILYMYIKLNYFFAETNRKYKFLWRHLVETCNKKGGKSSYCALF